MTDALTEPKRAATTFCYFLNDETLCVQTLFADIAGSFLGLCKKMFPPGAIFELKIHQNAFAAGDLPRTPLGKLTALPRPSSWFSGPLRGIDRRGGERKEGGKGKAAAFPHFFYTV